MPGLFMDDPALEEKVQTILDQVEYFIFFKFFFFFPQQRCFSMLFYSLAMGCICRVIHSHECHWLSIVFKLFFPFFLFSPSLIVANHLLCNRVHRYWLHCCLNDGKAWLTLVFVFFINFFATRLACLDFPTLSTSLYEQFLVCLGWLLHGLTVGFFNIFWQMLRINYHKWTMLDNWWINYHQWTFIWFEEIWNFFFSSELDYFFFFCVVEACDRIDCECFKTFIC